MPFVVSSTKLWRFQTGKSPDVQKGLYFYETVCETVSLSGFPGCNIVCAALSPSQPLGFTSALPKREIQLGFRLDF
jgi:hypothetical protein